VLPPAPLQLSVNALVTVSGPDVSLPKVALLPVQAPEAAQEVVFVEDQVRVEDAPLPTDVGFAASDTVGTSGGGGVPDTVTVADALVLAPVPVDPVQVRE